MDEQTTALEDFILISEIGQELSSFFDGVHTKDIRKAKSTQYLAKMLNSSFAILTLIPGNSYSNQKLTFQDNSSIYSLLRNQLEICNIFWYLIDEEFEENLFDLKLELLEFHDSISCRKVYHSLFRSSEIEDYYNEREANQLRRLESNSKFLKLNNHQKQQIRKGNLSTLSTQFEIAEKRNLNVDQFKAFYKLFSTHIHSSPTAMKNLSVSHLESSQEFDGIFFQLSMTYILAFMAEMILSVGKLWDMKFQKTESEQLLIHYSKQLRP